MWTIIYENNKSKIERKHNRVRKINKNNNHHKKEIANLEFIASDSPLVLKVFIC
jgi:hypothetical protein